MSVAMYVQVALLLVGLPGALNQIVQNCQWNTNSDAKSNELPTFTVNLDLPADQRWAEIVKPKRTQILHFINYAKKFLPTFIDNMVSLALEKAVHELPKPYGDEIIGIATALNFPVGDIFACNIFYELEKLCTSVIAQDGEGNVFHARNLDLGALLGWDLKRSTWSIAELLRPLSANINFESNGVVRYRTVQFIGTVGLFTGVAPGKFSISLNSRSSVHLFGGPLSIVSWLMSPGNKQFASLLAREVMEKAQNYNEAKVMLSSEPILAPVYYALAGTKKNEGVIITRSKTESIKPMELSVDKWFLVQTNYDNWKKPPFYDDRRAPSFMCLNQIRNKVTKTNMGALLYDVLSTEPILNKATIYTSLMSPKTGEFDTYGRNCRGPCYPW